MGDLLQAHGSQTSWRTATPTWRSWSSPCAASCFRCAPVASPLAPSAMSDETSGPFTLPFMVTVQSCCPQHAPSSSTISTRWLMLSQAAAVATMLLLCPVHGACWQSGAGHSPFRVLKSLCLQRAGDKHVVRGAGQRHGGRVVQDADRQVQHRGGRLLPLPGEAPPHPAAAFPKRPEPPDIRLASSSTAL